MGLQVGFNFFFKYEFQLKNFLKILENMVFGLDMYYLISTENLKEKLSTTKF